MRGSWVYGAGRVRGDTCSDARSGAAAELSTSEVTDEVEL